MSCLYRCSYSASFHSPHPTADIVDIMLKVGMLSGCSNFVQTEAEAAVAAIKAGTDMNCGCEYAAHLVDAVGNGTITHNDIDLAAGRITHAVIRTGGLDPQGKDSPYASIPTTKINDDAAARLALEAAQQSIVLLQNKPVGGVKDSSSSPLLPLKLSGTTKIAIVGPHANATDVMRSNYCGANTRVLSNSPSQAALRKWAGKAEVSVVPGLNNTVGRPWDPAGVAAAAAAAKAADIAIVFVGLTPCQGNLAGPWYAPTCNEGESHDRNEHTPDLGSLELPGSQQALVEAVAKVNPNYVVVLINGGALGIDWIKENSPAVVEAFYPCEARRSI